MAVIPGEFSTAARRAEHALATDPATGLAMAGTSEVTVVASAARTASGNGTAQTNINAVGGVFYINVSAASGTTPTLVVTIQGQDPVSGTWFTILASASITAVGTATLSIHPAITAAANVAAAAILPRTYRAIWTIGGTTPSFTFSVGASLTR